LQDAEILVFYCTLGANPGREGGREGKWGGDGPQFSIKNIHVIYGSKE